MLLAIVTFAIGTSAQTVTDETGALVRIHRFQPVLPPEAGSPARMSGGLSDSAIQQIDALELDKQTRTNVQQKISSHLIYTSRMLQGQPAAPGIPVLRSNMEIDDQNDLLVDIKAKVSADLLQTIRSFGGRIVSAQPPLHMLRALVPPGKLETIAASPDVVFISPRQQAMTVGTISRNKLNALSNGRPVSSDFAARAARVREQVTAQLKRMGNGIACTGQGSVTTEGYLTHQVDAACATFSVTGAGVNIGVLSDGALSLAASQTLGDLPPSCPAGPPCVTVLPGQTGDGDEGTAMMEIIHDIAPQANLFFATVDPNIETFAQNILDLRAAGCDIIVDDVIYFVETPFQDGQAPTVQAELDGGVVVQAVNDVTADGAVYFSSAGNEGSADAGFSDTYEGDFVDGGTNSHTGPKSGKVHKFGSTSYDVLTFFAGPDVPVVLHWPDPLGGSTNDYDLFILNPAGSAVVASSTEVQNGTQDPVEGVPAGEVNDRVVVFKATSAANRFFHLTAFGGLLSIGTQGAIVGHAGASGAYAVGATPAFEPICNNPAICPTGPFPNPFSSINLLEPFSSDGPRHIFFAADGTPITPGNFSSTGGTTLQKPQFTAADGVSVTGVGGFGSPFFGTSAAAPHAAAIAGLIKSSDLTLTNTEIGDFLSNTAIDIMGAGTDRDSGAGIVMALASMQASMAPKITDLQPPSGDTTTTVTLSGKHFGATQGTSTITFSDGAGGTVTATPTSWSDTSIAVHPPSAATTGNVVVTVNGVASNAKVFTYTPKIVGLNVNAAPIGSPVTITGTNFGGTQGTSTLKFNGTAATSITTWSATSIVANVPTGATTGTVVVAVNNVNSNGMPFTVEDFAFSAALTDMTVTAGSSQSETFTITSATGFDAAITFSCSGLPSKSTCTFNPASVTPGANPADVSLQVSTTASRTSGAGPGLFGIWLPFGGIGLVVAGIGTRKRTGKVLAAFGLFLLVPLMGAITSCGGGDGGHQTIPGTPAGTYTVNVTASSNGGTTHSETFKLTVN